jgi:hypothetical protein
MIAATPSLFEVSGSSSDLPFETERQAVKPCPRGGPMLNRSFISVIVIGVLLILPFRLSEQPATPQPNAGVIV